MGSASAGRIAKKRDISEYVAAGWSKGIDGYTYDIPQTNLDTAVNTYYDAPVSSGCVNGGSGTYCCINGAENPDCILPSQEVTASVYNAPANVPIYSEPTYTAGGDYEVTSDYFAPIDQDYLPPSEDSLREYLPPALRRRRRIQKRHLRLVKRQ